jgi:hypothetical protein
MVNLDNGMLSSALKNELSSHVNTWKRAGGVAPVVEHLPSKHEALSPNPLSHTHKKKDMEEI